MESAQDQGQDRQSVLVHRQMTERMSSLFSHADYYEENDDAKVLLPAGYGLGQACGFDTVTELL